MLGWMLDEAKRSGSGGAGGKPRIRFGNTGPRGRRYSTAAVKPKGGTCVVKSKYVKAGSDARRHISAHIRYIEERERGEGEEPRKFFDREHEGIERREVTKAMLENQGERAAMHKLILSPGDNRVDLVDYTRESMEALEERLGHKLDWYAVIHENTDHHHAHVVIAGKKPDREREIEKREAREESEEWKRLVDNQFGQDRGDWLAEWLEKEHDPDWIKEMADRADREEIDPVVRDLLPQDGMSAESFKINRMLDKIEREMAEREARQERGDVYIDRGDLAELRHAGNDYLERERSFDREFERQYEREFERPYEPTRGDEREMHERDWEEIKPMFDREQEPDRGREEAERGEGRSRGEDDDERKRGRGREDDFGR